jgi:Bacterial archaeo-eukaryotic release factor family 3
MQSISQNEIQSLLRKDGGFCVSIFLPTVRVGDTQQNKIRLKNLLRTAEKRLEEHEVRGSEAAELLKPARNLLDDQTWWEHQDEGLALFLAKDVFKSFRLPVAFHELVAVEKRFHLKPLFPLFDGDGHFYILCLTKRDIRLLSCYRFRVQEVDLGDMPSTFQDVMGELTRRYTQFQAGTSSKTVSRMPIFHGHGTGEDDYKAEILKFFQIVDNNLEHLAVDVDREAPFVLAGVEYLLPRFKEATRLPNVMEEGLTGNPEGLSAEELHAKAWEIVEPYFQRDRRRASERFGELQGTGRAASDIREILPAAHDGRVDALFTARGVRIWGTYDPETREVQFQEEQEAQGNGSEDLIDRAAVQTFLHGGKVFAVDQQEVPQGYKAAAVFRY